MWTVSSVASARAAATIGAARANRQRLFIALTLLAVLSLWCVDWRWNTASWWFVLSGAVGLGVGDLALFGAYRRLGARLPALFTHTLAAPTAALLEWLWLGAAPTWPEAACGVVILTGVALALAPKERAHIPRGVFWSGFAFSVLSALGLATSAVLSRKANSLGLASHAFVPGLDMATLRNLGGVALVLAVWPWERLHRRLTDGGQVADYRRGWAWLVLSGVVGPGIGVVCYQVALTHAKAGPVQAVVALVPLLVIPLAWRVEGDRPGIRALMGGLLGVGGAVAMALVHT